MSNEVEENLTLFFRHFLNTSQEMDAHLGVKGSFGECQASGGVNPK
jgi:hypothetical protein